MKTEKNYNYDNFYDFEEVTGKIIKKFITRYKKLLHLKFRNFDLEKACEKYLYYKINSSVSFYNFFCDVHKKKLKKNYIFDNYELMLLALELGKLYNLKCDNLFYKKNYLKNFFFLIIYFFIILFSYFFTFRKKINKNIICILNHKKFKNKFEYLLNKIKKEKLYISYRNFIPFFNFYLIRPNFKIYFENILRQKKFLLIHRLYLKTYVFDCNISMNSPLFIIFYEGDSTDHEIASEIAKKLNIKSICVQWGSLLYNKPKSSFRNSGYTTLLAWSKESAKIFLKYNPEINAKYIGSPNLKSYTYKKNKILFLLPQTSPQFDLVEMQNFYDLIEWTIKKFPKQVTVRTHPQDSFNHNTKGISNQNKAIIDDAKKISLARSLSQSFLMITVGSSAIFEAGHLGVIPLLYAKSKRKVWNQNIQNLKSNYDLRLFENKKIINLKKTIILLNNNKNLRKKISKKISKNFKKEILLSGSKSIKKFNNFIENIISKY